VIYVYTHTHTHTHTKYKLFLKTISVKNCFVIKIKLQIYIDNIEIQ